MEGIAISDFQGLNQLKQQAQADAQGALPEVARQFEAIFLQTMMKTMRNSSTFLDESSPFKGKQQEMFQDMLDGQYVSKMTQAGGIGLAEMLTRQLSATMPKSAPPAVNNVTLAEPVSIPNAPVLPTNEPPAADEFKVTTIDEFVQSIWPYARQAASALGLDPKILMAQAALETGWGKFVAKDSNGQSSHNLFNIKASRPNKEDAVTIKTTEYIADTPIKMNAAFKKYASVGNSFNDYVSLLKENSRYGSALENAHNPQRFVEALHEAGYATDPQYASKILSIYHGEELQGALDRAGYHPSDNPITGN